jgi:hypothetical protein
MGTELMPVDEGRVFAAIGRLEERFDTLTKRFDALEDHVTTEQRKVHDIVVAQSEAARILTRDVAEMKPLTDDYREKRAEARGAARLAGWLYTAAAAAGGMIAVGAGKLFDLISNRPHIPVLVILVTLLAIGRALAADDGRYAQSPLKDWVKGLKDKNGDGCCDTSDGFPAEVEWDTESNHYRVRIDGAWHVVPPDAVLTEPNKLGYPMVWYWFLNGVPQIRCFIPGAGG